MTIKKQAGRGIITPEMRQVAEYEDVPVEFIADGISKGTIVIPKNKQRAFTHVRGIGKGLRTKINANIGSSPYHMDRDEEVQKAHAAIIHGADTIMDLSLGKEIISIRCEILKECGVALGTVPLYQTAFELSRQKRDITGMTIKDFLATVKNQAEEGVDFMTIHAGVTRQALDALESQKRVLDVVSRGGSFLISWIKKHGRQSPLYE
ncbi:MAG TPA: phosphomethylpyrimidine synthase, partial [Deltaproteobacteria bacterium]|nr:phosphomethylpyrimidine synthase [Deltaproteobacteria bacterium]